MKFVFMCVIGLLCLGGIGYYFFGQSQKVTHTEVVPVGFYRMEDGTFMEDETVTKKKPSTTDAIRQEETSKQATVTLDPNARVFDITAVNYGFSVKEIRVKKGETVTINFQSTDGFHDLVVDEFDVRTDKVSPGKPTSVTFVADTVGTFEYYCSVGSHRSHGMVGSLTVEE